MSTLLTVAGYAAHTGKSVRQVQRYVREGRLPGVIETDNGVMIPADARPSALELVVAGPSSTPAATSPTSPLGALGTLEEAARILGTTVGGVRRLAADPATPFVVGRYGPRGALRVYVFPPR